MNTERTGTFPAPISRKTFFTTSYLRTKSSSDTVGFISRLPHEFIDAFAGTLEETKYADLILHVVDGQDPDLIEHFDVVKEVLRKIGAEDIPAITVINKCENGTPAVIPADDEHVVFISALTGEGVDALKEKISLALFGETHIWE